MPKIINVALALILLVQVGLAIHAGPDDRTGWQHLAITSLVLAIAFLVTELVGALKPRNKPPQGS